MEGVALDLRRPGCTFDAVRFWLSYLPPLDPDESPLELTL